MVTGVLYCSTKSSNVQNRQLEASIESVAAKKSRYVVLTSEFNYPVINWKEQSATVSDGHPADRFLGETRLRFALLG